MIKMKKKWLRGGASLALVAALSFSSVMPVWAALPPTAAVSGDNVTVTLDDETHKAGSVTTENKAYVDVNNHTKFTVTVPKKITLDETICTAQNNSMIVAGKLSVNADIAPTQTLSVVPSSVTLETPGLTKSTVTAHTLSSQISKDNSAYANYIIITGKESDASTDQNFPLWLKLTNTSRKIKAGNWRGVITFKVAITDDSYCDHATSADDGTWNNDNVPTTQSTGRETNSED